MKKFVIFMMTALCAVVLISSCQNKKDQGTPLAGNESLLTFEKASKYGLKSSDGRQILTCEYDSISYNKEFKLIVAKKGDETSLLDVSGFNILTDQVVSMQTSACGLDVQGCYVKTASGHAYYIASPTLRKRYDIKGSGCWGKMEEIVLVGQYLFFKDGGKWGAATVNSKGLAPRKFDKVYIVENDKTFGVLVNDGEWKLYDSGGVSEGDRYDLSSKDIVKQLKKSDVSAPYGLLIKPDWKL